VGIVVEWKGYMGWIQPLLKIQHEQAKRHWGRIYLNASDIANCSPADGFPPPRVKEGKVVDFFLYVDADGLGAQECRARSVLRLTLPYGEANRRLKGSPQWSEYLSDSEHYPAFERDHGVLLRKYNWQLAFAVLELWGHPDELATSAMALAVPDEGDYCDVRLLVPEDDLHKVESIPDAPKVSAHLVLHEPVRCHSLMLQTTRSSCREAILAHLQLMAGPSPAAGA